MIQLMVFGVLGVHGAHAAVSAPCLETDPVTTHLLSLGAKSVLETQQVIPKINNRNQKQYPGESLAFQKLLLALEIFVAQETQSILDVSKHPHCLKQEIMWRIMT